MTAALQAATTSGDPVVLLYDTKAGHAGGRSLTKVIEDTTMEMAFSLASSACRALTASLICFARPPRGMPQDRGLQTSRSPHGSIVAEGT
jgi:hypothetical protein